MYVTAIGAGITNKNTIKMARITKNPNSKLLHCTDPLYVKT